MPGFVLTRVTAGLNPLYSEPYSEPSDNLFPAPPLCCTPPSCGRWPLIVVYPSPLLHFPQRILESSNGLLLFLELFLDLCWNQSLVPFLEYTYNDACLLA